MSVPADNEDERWTQIRARLLAFEQRIATGFAPTAEARDLRLQARTREWARALPVEQPDAWLEVLSFDLGQERYAIETCHVAEVLPLSHFTPLPNTPPYVLGIVNVRGRVVSVLDLRVLFELPISGLSDKNFLVVLQSPEMEFGLLIDRVQGIQPLERDTLQSGLANLTGVRAHYLLGVTTQQCTVLDGTRLLGDPSLRVEATL
ncbi:MAG TPA: chemotaxis protein CheW [Pseudomonas sp.]|nr:chemotaxis protein CheW [Pseudomonas sp.]